MILLKCLEVKVKVEYSKNHILGPFWINKQINEQKKTSFIDKSAFSLQNFFFASLQLNLI